MKNKINLRLATQAALEPLRAAGSIPPAVMGLAKPGQLVSMRHDIEGVHFDSAFVTPYDLGRKTMAIALFELVGSSAVPRRVQVTTGVNQATTETFLGEVFRGMKKVADEFEIELAFGNAFHSPTCFLMSLLTVSEHRAPLPKPKPGDVLAVTGKVGAAAAGLNALRRFGWPAVKDYPEVVSAHLCPQPPLKVSLQLARAKAVTSMTPGIDGASADLHRLAVDTQLGIHLDEALLPVSEQTAQVANTLGASPRRWALFGGEDYGMFMTVPAKNWKSVQTKCQKAGTTLTAVGELRPKTYSIQMLNLEGEKIRLANRSWNPLVRRKVSKN
jgi:thiamine-monophosphate kinase